jgi:hypothetical protein
MRPRHDLFRTPNAPKIAPPPPRPRPHPVLSKSKVHAVSRHMTTSLAGLVRILYSGHGRITIRRHVSSHRPRPPEGLGAVGVRRACGLGGYPPYGDRRRTALGKPPPVAVRTLEGHDPPPRVRSPRASLGNSPALCHHGAALGGRFRAFARTHEGAACKPADTAERVRHYPPVARVRAYPYIFLSHPRRGP